jgi:hypothetical protein
LNLAPARGLLGLGILLSLGCSAPPPEQSPATADQPQPSSTPASSTAPLSAPAPAAPKPPETAVTRALAAADKTFSGRRYEEALVEYRAAAQAAKSSGDASSEVEALAQVARMHSLAKPPRLDEARAELRRAQEVASPDHPWGWTRYLGVRGILEREGGDKTQALATFVEYHDYALARGLYTRAIDAAHHAAIVAPPAEQLRWAKRGIAAAEAGDEEGWLAVLWNNLGASHEDRGDWKAAVEAYAKAKHYHDRRGGPLQKLAAAWALGRASLRAGDLERAGALLPGCLETARAGIEGAPENEQREWLGFALASHGELLLARGERVAGLNQLQEGRQLLVAAGIEKWWAPFLSDLDQRIAAAKKRGQ